MILAKIDEVRAIMAGATEEQGAAPSVEATPEAKTAHPEKTDVYDAVKRCTAAGVPIQAIMDLFAKYNAKDLSSLSLEHYPAVIRACEEMLP